MSAPETPAEPGRPTASTRSSSSARGSRASASCSRCAAPASPTSCCSRSPRRSGAPGATTPIPGARATSRRTCTRSRRVPNPDWSRSYSPQPEIREYLERVADAEDLRRHVRFGQEMTGATWDEQSRTWTVHTRLGRSWRARFLVHGVGALHLPRTPDLPGAASFGGPVLPLRAVGPRRRPAREEGRGHRHRGQRHPVRAADRRRRGGGAALPAHPGLGPAQERQAAPGGPPALLRPPPARPPGVPVGDVRGAGVARPRLQLEPGGPATRRVARRQAHRAPDRRPRARREADARLLDRLQAGAGLQRLLPDAQPPRRRRRHRRRPRGPGLVDRGRRRHSSGTST